MKVLQLRTILFTCLLAGSLLIAFQLPALAASNPNSTVSDLFQQEQEDNEQPPAGDLDIKTPAADQKNEGAADRLSAWDYIRTLFSLLFVIGILIALLKFVNRKNRLHNKTRLMKNLGGISLGQQKSIQLVVIGDSYYVVGVGEDIRLLKEITDPEEIEHLTEFYEEAGEDMPVSWLSQFTDKWTTGRKKKNPYNSREEEAPFSEHFHSKLEELKEERKREFRRLTEKERHPDE